MYGCMVGHWASMGVSGGGGGARGESRRRRSSI